MMEMIDSFSEVIITKYPSTPQYIQEVPTGFLRPSFYISFIDKKIEPLTKDVYKGKYSFEIIYFAPKDRRGNIDKALQYEEMAKIDKMFNQRGLSIVGTDRVATVDDLYLHFNNDGEIMLEVDLTLTGTVEDLTFTYPVMKELNINMKLNEGGN